MARLYKYHNYSSHWVAYTETEGWMLFPMGAGGWEQRRAAKGLDPLHLRQVPLWMGFNTGISGAPTMAGGQQLFPEAA
jgi:hypothetical protein